MAPRITKGQEDLNLEYGESTTFIAEAISEDTARQLTENSEIDTEILEVESPVFHGSHSYPDFSQFYALSPAQPVVKGQNRPTDPISFTGVRPHDALQGADVADGVALAGTKLKLAKPRYPLIAAHRFLLGNPWHFACVMAKAGATTEMGYDWVTTKGHTKGVVSAQLKRLLEFEDRVYEKTHKDITGILRDVSIDYFSTGNLNLELQYTMGGTLDCMYPIPAITCYRHLDLPLGVQCLPEDQIITGMSVPFDVAKTMGVQAVMPLFLSKLPYEEYQDLIPEQQKATQIGYSEMLHEANSIISTDPIYGIADILPALAALLGDNAASDYNLQFFENNAVPRYAVTISGGRVTDKVKQDIVTFLDKHIRGKNHRTIVIPLPSNVTAKFEALDNHPAEGSFLAYKKINREEIAAAHKVPPSEIGLWENSNRANAMQQAKNYYLKVIQPFQARLTRMMNRAIRTGLKITNYEFQFKNVEYTDDQEWATVQDTVAKAMHSRMSSLTSAISTVQNLLASDDITLNKDALNGVLESLVNKLKDVDIPLDR